MKPFRIPVAVAALALSSHGALNAQAADVFPNKPVRMIVAFPVAGATDILARVLSQKWASNSATR